MTAWQFFRPSGQGENRGRRQGDCPNFAMSAEQNGTVPLATEAVPHWGRMGRTTRRSHFVAMRSGGAEERDAVERGRGGQSQFCYAEERKSGQPPGERSGQSPANAGRPEAVPLGPSARERRRPERFAALPGRAAGNLPLRSSRGRSGNRLAKAGGFGQADVAADAGLESLGVGPGRFGARDCGRNCLRRWLPRPPAGSPIRTCRR